MMAICFYVTYIYTIPDFMKNAFNTNMHKYRILITHTLGKNIEEKYARLIKH